MERPIGIEPTPEPWQVCRERSVNNLRGTFRSTKSHLERSETLNGPTVGPTRKAGWHPLYLNRERVQDSYSGLVSLDRESVIVSEQGLRSLGRPPLLGADHPTPTAPFTTLASLCFQ